MRKFLTIFVVMSLTFTAAISVSSAQETQATETEAEMYFAAGTIVEASAGKIVISEYDFDAGQETNVTYEVNLQTQFEGAAGVSELKAGDDVEVEYQAVGDKKVATRIEKYAVEEEAIEDMTNFPMDDEPVNEEEVMIDEESAAATMTDEEVNEEVMNAESRAEGVINAQAAEIKKEAQGALNDMGQKKLDTEGAAIETNF